MRGTLNVLPSSLSVVSRSIRPSSFGTASMLLLLRSRHTSEVNNNSCAASMVVMRLSLATSVFSLLRAYTHAGMFAKVLKEMARSRNLDRLDMAGGKADSILARTSSDSKAMQSAMECGSDGSLLKLRFSVRSVV